MPDVETMTEGMFLPAIFWRTVHAATISQNRIENVIWIISDRGRIDNNGAAAINWTAHARRSARARRSAHARHATAGESRRAAVR
jgi:hypothetical protein